ncbi:MAG TPA: diaminopimelate decarboxylase [Streptosporangiaceae bacterium]|nr:diaminopimelate decarboxylase [Streptosporangiaceae bacterium]
MLDLSLLPPSALIEGDDLRIGGCLLADIADRYGTPAFVIDEQALRSRAAEYTSALTSRHPGGRVCFAVKAYPAVSVIRVLAQSGLGCDVVGAGELRMALAAGAEPAAIVMHGNAKSDEDIAAALEAGIGFIVVDGFDDIDRIERFASRRTPVLLRVSPGIDSATHAAMATGGKNSKFGVPADQVPAAIARMRAIPTIDLRGLHAHIGSQIATLDQFEAAVAALASFDRFDVYDFGGGLAVRYEPGDTVPTVDQYVASLVGAAHRHLGTDVEIIIEPGRSVVARAGVTLYRVVTVKQSGKLHVAVDGGMGDNLEPSLYGQRFTPMVLGHWNDAQVQADVVGRHCEEGDVITGDVTVTQPRVGDLMVVPATGAYCFTMANNYNAALRPPVIFCDNGTARVAIRRETFDDLLARETELYLA